MGLRNKIFLSRKAKDDLDEIWIYTSTKWNSKQADDYLMTIQEGFVFIEKFPHLGVVLRNHKLNKIYSLRIKSHRIIYRVGYGNKIFIIRILHDKMNLINRI